MVINIIFLYKYLVASFIIRSYIIRGELPIYKPPSTTHSKLENRLNSQQEDRMKHEHKNFLSSNIRKINDTSSILKSSFQEEKSQLPKLKKL